MYHALGGEGWDRNRGWLEEGEPCGGHNETQPSWYGLECSGDAVVQLDLSSNNLRGTLPEGLIRGVPHLKKVYLYSNQLSGTLPAEWLSHTPLM